MAAEEVAKQVAEQVAHIPFYADWKFWSFVASGIAIWLSQVSPVRFWFRKARVEAEPFTHIGISHRIGNPNVQLHIMLSNTGGRSVRILGMQLRIRRGNEDDFTLQGRGYFAKTDDQNALLLTAFNLKRDEEWTHIVNFFEYLSRQEDRQYRQAETNVRNDIITKRQAMDPADRDVAAEPALVKPIEDLFDDKFRWVPGEYQVTLTIRTEPPNAGQDKTYRMTIFESDTQELMDAAAGYKFGYGLFLNDPRQRNLIINLSE